MARKPELYRWKSSIPDPTFDFSPGEISRDYSSAKKPVKNDIKDWMKTVEAASDQAIGNVFGTGKASRKHKSPSSQITTVNVREHEAAYAEAQDLLNEWMKDKITFEPEEFDHIEEYSGPTQTEIRKQWDDLLQQDHYKVGEEQKQIEYDFDLEKEDTDDIVDDILQNLMKKELVRSEVKKDLGLNRQEIFQGPDPRTKMHLRHEQVKENREKREREKRQKLEQKQNQRDVQLQAKQVVMKEEKEKQQKHRHEELMVQKEVARLRREMLEQRKREEEQKQKQIQAEERLRYEAQMELERQQWQEEQMELDVRLQEEKRRKDMEVIKQFQAKIAAKDIKKLQRVFSAWYNVVLERRLQLGKVEAMADWKLLVRTFNAWKSFVRHNRLDKETQVHQENMKEHVRRNQVATRHHEHRLLKRCLAAWQVFVRQSETSRETERERAQTKSKMASFLEAASSGKLVNEKKADEEHVNNLFAEQPRPMTKRPDSARSVTSSRSSRSAMTPTKSRSDTDQRRPPNARPIQAWQVTKKHLDLSPGQISELGQGEGHNELNELPNPDENSPERKREVHHRMHKWTSPESGNYDNRHKTQQQILKMQREQLKEQQKMIEDLKFLQNQQLLQQQLHHQQIETQRLNNTQVVKVATKRPSTAKSSVTPSPKSDVTNGDVTERSQADTARSDSTTVSNSTTRSKTTVNNGRHDGFIRKMEDRAAERLRLKEERERKKREQEKENLAKLESEQAEQRQREEEEKVAKIEAKKEQKRLEKQRELEKQSFQERLRIMTLKAEEFYQRSQLKYRGLLPWKQYVEVSQQQLRTARWHHESRLLRNYFNQWCQSTEESIKEKEIRSERFHQVLIMKRCFRNWRRLRQAKNYLQDKADHCYHRNLLWRVLQAWTDYTTDEKLRMWKLERVSKEHDVIRLQKRAFIGWRKLPEVEAQERARSKRLSEMRSKVASMLPDFQKSLDEG